MLLLFLLCLDEVFVKSYRTGETVVLHILIQTVHTLHLLGAVDNRSKADAVFAYLLIEACVGCACHNVGTGSESGEGFSDNFLYKMKGFAVDINGLRLVT